MYKYVYIYIATLCRLSSLATLRMKDKIETDIYKYMAVSGKVLTRKIQFRMKLRRRKNMPWIDRDMSSHRLKQTCVLVVNRPQAICSETKRDMEKTQRNVFFL